MPHDNERSWTSPIPYQFQSYGNPPSAANFFADMAQESAPTSNTARNSATHGHWGTVLNSEPERAPATGRYAMSRAASRPSTRLERTSTEITSGSIARSSQSIATSQVTERQAMANADNDFTPRFPVAPPPREEPPTPVPSTVHSPASIRPAPGLERLSDNLSALRSYGASRTVPNHRSVHQADATSVTSEQKSSFQPIPTAKAATVQSPTSIQPVPGETRGAGKWSMNPAGATSPTHGQASASNRFRFNPTAEFRPRFSFARDTNEKSNHVTERSSNNEVSQPQTQQGYSATGDRSQYGTAGNRSMSGIWNNGACTYDFDLSATLRQEPTTFGAREVDDLTSNLGVVSLSTSNCMNRTTTASTTPPTTATSRGSSGSVGSSGFCLPSGSSTWNIYNAVPMIPHQTSRNDQPSLVGNSLGDSSPDSDAHVPDHVFHDFAATLRARAHPTSVQQQQSAQAGYGQDARGAVNQDFGRGPSYRFKDFANPMLDGPLYTAQSVYIVVEFKLHRAELFQMAPEWGMEDLLSRSDLFVKVEADRGYDVGLVVMASGDLEEARDDRQARYKRHWNSIVDFSARPHWRNMGEKQRKENFEGYYNHMSSQPLTNEYKGGARPPGIVCTVAPWVVEDLRFKEAGEMKAKRRCAEAAASIANLDCEVVGAEYQLDCQKLTVFYVSDSYIDYKELSHNLYRTFKTRLWFVALNPDSFYPPTRAPGYDHRLLAQQPTQRPLQPGDSQFYAAPALASPSSLAQASGYTGPSSMSFISFPYASSNAGSSYNYSTPSGHTGQNSMAQTPDHCTSFSNGSLGLPGRYRQPSQSSYGLNQYHSSMAPDYGSPSTFGSNSQPRLMTNAVAQTMQDSPAGMTNSRSVSFSHGPSSFRGNGISSPSATSRSSSFGNGVSLPFGHGAFSSFAPTSTPGPTYPSQYGYSSSAAPPASYFRAHTQHEPSGVARDFGPIGPRNRQ